LADTAEKPSFIADAMLGRLAKSLRTLGYDTEYSPDITDADLKLAALRDGRVLLTRDLEIGETSLPVRVLLVESDRVEEQLVQVVDELGLEAGPGLFTRCLICNVTVVDVERASVRDRVPPYVFRTQERFVRCPSCGRVYWPATHVERAREWLDRVLGTGRGPEADSGEGTDGASGTDSDKRSGA
jgi:uncharacterized protein with PIN domain